MNMKSMVVMMITALVASACVSAPELPVTTPYNLNAPEIDAVKQGVTQRARNKQGLIFGPIRGARDERGLIHVCGVVNPKNAEGAYSGNETFIGVLSTSKFGAQTVASFRMVIAGGVHRNGREVSSLALIELCKKLGVAS